MFYKYKLYRLEGVVHVFFSDSIFTGETKKFNRRQKVEKSSTFRVDIKQVRQEKFDNLYHLVKFDIKRGQKASLKATKKH